MFSGMAFLSIVHSFLVILQAVTTCDLALAKEAQTRPVITQEIQFVSSEAGEVFLIWGVDGWKTIPADQQPSGTLLKNAVMHTPMTRRQDHFAATLQVSPGTLIDFGFLVTRTKEGVDINIWESNGKDPYHETVSSDHAITVHSRANILQGGKAPREKWNALLELMISMLCLAVPLRVAVLLIGYRHRSWHRRVRLPAFKKPMRPTVAGDALLVGISLLFGLVMAELILHAMDPNGSLGAARELEWVRKGGPEIERSFRIDASLGLRPRLNYGPYSEHGTVMNTYSFSKPAETTRILILGSKAVFQGHLVEALRQIHPQSEVEIWNGGVSTYGTVQSINFYKQYQSRIQPDKIILFVTPGDIETTPIAYRDAKNNIVAFAPYFANSSVTSYLFTYSHLYRLIVGLLAVTNLTEDSVFQEMRATLSDLATALRKDRIDFLVVLVPLLFPEEMWTADEKEQRVATLKMLGNSDIHYIDLLPPLRTAIRENLDLRQHAGNPFEPSETLAKHFGAYLQGHGFARNMDLRADHHEHH